MATKKNTKAKETKMDKPATEVKPVKTKFDPASITIESDVPIPTVGVGRSQYPFEALQVGQSFLVPADGAEDAKRVRNNLRSAGKRIEKSSGMRFIVLVRAEEKGVRVWRTEDAKTEKKQKAVEVDDVGMVSNDPSVDQQIPSPPTQQLSTDNETQPKEMSAPPIAGDPWPTV